MRQRMPVSDIATLWRILNEQPPAKVIPFSDAVAAREERENDKIENMTREEVDIILVQAGKNPDEVYENLKKVIDRAWNIAPGEPT